MKPLFESVKEEKNIKTVREFLIKKQERKKFK